jgi:hypothetical protein
LGYSAQWHEGKVLALKLGEWRIPGADVPSPIQPLKEETTFRCRGYVQQRMDFRPHASPICYMLLWILVDVVDFNLQDPAEDEIVWTRSTYGNYLAKSLYEMQFDGSLESSFPTRV